MAAAKDLNNQYYIQLYNMKKSLLHSPTLGSVLMVEKTIHKYSQEYGKYQLWKKLPKKMMYQTFLTILDYLESSGKIMVDKDGIVIWLWDPERIRALEKKGLVFR
jgi:hypothetical protein